MSKRRRLADLRVYLDDDGALSRTIAVTASRTGATKPGGYEVYLSQFHDAMAGRSSFHASGLTISRSELVKTEQRAWRGRIADVAAPERLVGLSYWSARRDPSRPPDFAAAGVSEDSEKRRSVVLPVPEHPHGYEIFVAPKPIEDLVAWLAETPPYPASRVSAVLTAEWLTPTLILVVWEATNDAPYRVTESHHEPTRSARLAIVPTTYHGTWVAGRRQADVLLHGPYRGPWPSSEDIDPTAFFGMR